MSKQKKKKPIFSGGYIGCGCACGCTIPVFTTNQPKLAHTAAFYFSKITKKPPKIT